MAHSEAVRDHEVRDFRQGRVTTDAGSRQRAVERREPACPFPGGVLPLEFEESLEGGQDRADRVTQ